MKETYEEYMKRLAETNKSWELDISKPMRKLQKRAWDPASLVWKGGKDKKI